MKKKLVMIVTLALAASAAAWAQMSPEGAEAAPDCTFPVNTCAWAQMSPMEAEAERARLAQAQHKPWVAQPPDQAAAQPSAPVVPPSDPQVEAARILAEAKIRAAQIQAQAQADAQVRAAQIQAQAQAQMAQEMKRQRRAQAWRDLANWYNQTYIQPYQQRSFGICNTMPMGIMWQTTCW